MLMGLNGCINLYRRGELEEVLKGYTFCTDRGCGSQQGLYLELTVV